MKSFLVCLCLSLACLVACKKEKQAEGPKGCLLTSITSSQVSSALDYENFRLAMVTVNARTKNQSYGFSYDSVNRIEKISGSEGFYLKLSYTNNQVSEYFMYSNGVLTSSTKLYYMNGLLSKSENYSAEGQQQSYTSFITDDQQQILQSSLYAKLGSSFTFVKRMVYTYSAAKSDKATNFAFANMFNITAGNVIEHLSNPYLPASVRTESYNPQTRQPVTESELNITYVTNEQSKASSFEINDVTNSEKTTAAVAYKCTD
ncbi:MAG: hypothetical protein V4658_09735 [Bacteroidota bacterium]